jgi:excisionase family DNA binding protein
MEWLSAAEAAAALGVSERQVRRLVGSGLLHAERVGGVWLVSADAVRSRARDVPAVGRPLSAPMAWAVLGMVDAGLDALNERRAGEQRSGRLDANLDRRVRHRLRTMALDGPSPVRWSHWLSRRASRQRIWAHPGVVDRLVDDGRLRPAGGYPAARRGAGIAAAPLRRLYVDEADLDVVLSQYKANLDAAGDLELMVIPELVPLQLRPAVGEPVPLAVALVDLLESADARERHVALELLEGARAAGAGLR